MRLRRKVYATAIGASLAIALLAGCASTSRVASTPPPPRPAYEVYAVRYAVLRGYPTHELVAGADTSRRSDLAMTVWLLKGPGDRNVLVDAGFYRDAFVLDAHPTAYHRSSEVLESLGVAPGSITDIIISHVHWDHLDGTDLYPNARVWIQRAEFEYYVGPKGESLHDDISRVDAVMLAKLRAAGRVELVDGDAKEIIPGIRVFTGGRHTYASQYAAVNTRVGTVVIASDNVYLYENLARHAPIGTTFDAKANLRAQDRMVGMAAAKRFVIPGHDPAVFERFPRAGKNIVRIDQDAGTGTGSTSAVRRELEQRYDENVAAFLAKDFAAIMALRTEDFHAVTPDSVVHDRADMGRSTHAFLDGIDHWIATSIDIDSLEVSGDLARAIVHQHADRMARRSDGLVHHVETWVTQREIWRWTPEGWKLYRVDSIRDQKRLIDGQPG